ncbi:MAG: hypothetical protein K2O40_14805 [Lachnospiraceae bacterium]|nr:hypothetical protein [Lachnospiraceae bacterium]
MIAIEPFEQWFGHGLNIIKVYGIRTFWDLQQNQAIEQSIDWQEKRIQIEIRVSEMEAFRAIAFFHHVLLKSRRRGTQWISG